MTGVAARAPGDGFRRALRDNLAAGVAAFRPQINDPIRRFDHLEIVLNHQERVAGGAEFEQHLEQLGDDMEVQADAGLVETSITKRSTTASIV